MNQFIANAGEGSIVGRSFNQTLLIFLQELQAVFPDEPSLDFVIQALNLANEDKPMDPLNGWLKSMKLLRAAGYEQPFFTECTTEKINCFMGLLPQMHPLLRMIPLENMWNDPGLLDEDRSCIWEHLAQLEMSSMTIDAFDPKAVSAIESLAKDYLGELNGLDPNTINVQSLGFDVIKRVMNDTRIRDALADPIAEKRFAETFGQNGEKFSLLTSGSQAHGMSQLLEQLANAGTGASAEAAAAGAGVPGVPAPAQLLQMMGASGPNAAELEAMLKGMGVDPAAASGLLNL